MIIFRCILIIVLVVSVAYNVWLRIQIKRARGEHDPK